MASMCYMRDGRSARRRLGAVVERGSKSIQHTVRGVALLKRSTFYLQYDHDQSHITTESVCDFGRRSATVATEEARRKAPQWRCVNEEDMEKVRTLREDEHLRARFENSALWSCSLCPTFNAIWTAMSAHLEET